MKEVDDFCGNDRVKIFFNRLLDKKDEVFKKIEKNAGVVCTSMIFPRVDYTGTFNILAVVLKHDLIHSIHISDTRCKNTMCIAFVFTEKFEKQQSKSLESYNFYIDDLKDEEIEDKILKKIEEYFNEDRLLSRFDLFFAQEGL